MKGFLEQSVFFGVFISLSAYGAGTFIQKKCKYSVCNPLLIALLLVITVIVSFKVDYTIYYKGAKYLSYLLTPATVALAIPLYEQVRVLRHNAKAIFAGILSGVITSLCSILAMALLFGLTHEEYVTFLPKSITTAIGMEISKGLGGTVSVTVAVIVVTGVFGGMIAEPVLKLFRISDPVAKGVGMGTAAHAVGTAKAMELGKTEGAVSSLSLIVSGVLTVIGASVFAQFI